MILHAASIAAFFLQQAPQPQCIVKCVQAAGQDPLWARLLFAAIPSVFALGIAWMAVRWNKNKEHDQWILDQKRAEWSALLRGVANVFHITNFTTLNGWNRKIADRIAAELEQALEEISIACANCIFLDNFRQNKEGDRKIDEFLKNTKLQAQKLNGNLGLFNGISDRVANAGIASDIDTKSLNRNIEIVSGQISDLAEQSRTLLDWLQVEAARDLGVTAKGEEHQAAREGTKLFNFTRKKTGA